MVAHLIFNWKNDSSSCQKIEAARTGSIIYIRQKGFFYLLIWKKKKKKDAFREILHREIHPQKLQL